MGKGALRTWRATGGVWAGLLLQKTAERRKASGSHVSALEAHRPLLTLASRKEVGPPIPQAQGCCCSWHLLTCIKHLAFRAHRFTCACAYPHKYVGGYVCAYMSSAHL